MSKNSDQQKYDTPRSGPRAAAALDVDVVVEGQKRRVRLVSQDIGAGGIFLRTEDPAPVFKKVKLILKLPDGGNFEVAGEVVRSITPTQAHALKRPAGMAVAFDEVSRSKRKELTALVLDLCARRPEKKSEAAAKPTPPRPAEEAKPKPPEERSESDELLDEIDSLLDSVEDEIESDPSIEDTQPELMTPSFVKKDRKPSAETPPPLPVEPEEPEPGTEPELQEPVQDPIEKLRSFLNNYKTSQKRDTYYNTLGVAPTASATEIEKAYKQLLEDLKPPGTPDSLPTGVLRDLSVVLGKVRKAYAILSKPDRKRAYDFLIDNETGD